MQKVGEGFAVLFFLIYSHMDANLQGEKTTDANFIYTWNVCLLLSKVINLYLNFCLIH